MLVNYLRDTTNLKDKGYTVALLTGNLKFSKVTSKTIKDIVKKNIDPYLFDLSYDYVGDLAETVSMLWNEKKVRRKYLSISQLVEVFDAPDTQPEDKVFEILNYSDLNTRWALIKILLGGLRVGMSTNLVKTALSIYGSKNKSEIEMIWNGIKPPYESFFLWLEDKGQYPLIKNSETFHPFLLAHAIDLEDLYHIDINNYIIEYKWDGIRVQIVSENNSSKIYSRNGEEITCSFPEIQVNSKKLCVLDGELLVKRNKKILPFNKLQKRINKKKPSKRLLLEMTAFVKLYDILFYNNKDVRSKNQLIRKNLLKKFFMQKKTDCLDLSSPLTFKNIQDINYLYSGLKNNEIIEGLVLKNINSNYVGGRKKNIWYKLKKKPKLLDVILMYAQRGHGKRSSYYSDYTFGVWQNNKVIPIAKAYSGYTNDELEKIDRFIRGNVVATFGPVKEVKKKLVFELAFDSIHKSSRHKSGLALRFPRVNLIRWDKPANEVLQLQQVKDEFKIKD